MDMAVVKPWEHSTPFKVYFLYIVITICQNLICLADRNYFSSIYEYCLCLSKIYKWSDFCIKKRDFIFTNSHNIHLTKLFLY